MNPQQLRDIAVLAQMDDLALDRLAEALETKDYDAGQTVFTEGDPGDSMYFIAKGKVRIEKRAQASGAAAKTLTVLETGNYFGEMALMDQKPRSASAVAAEEARLYRLSKGAFDAMQQASSAAGMSVLFAMIRTSSDRIRRLSTQLVVYDEVGKAIGEATDLQTLLDVILQQLLTASSADWGFVLLRSQFSERLEVRSLLNLPLTSIQRDKLMNAEGFVTEALQDPQPQLVGCFGQEEPFKSCPRLGFETPSLLIAPISVGSQLLGLIFLGGHGKSQFNLDALTLASGVARQTAQAILNARHREEEQARSRHARQYVKF